MEPKQMLESFEFSITNYTASLGADHPKIVKARTLLEEMHKKADGGADIVALSGDLGELGVLLGELASEQPVPQASGSGAQAASAPEMPSSGDVPPASVAAAGYHMAWSQFPPAQQEQQKPYYDRIFAIEAESENAVFFNAKLREDGVLLNMSRDPLVKIARDALEKSREIFSPTVDYQQNLAITTYENVNTVAELEFEGAKMAGFSNVEHEWDAMFCQVIGSLCACATAIMAFGDGEENVKKLQNSYKFMAETMGISWEIMVANERFRYLFENVLFPKVSAAQKAMMGTTPDAFLASLKEKYFDPYIKEEPVPELNPERNVRFWRSEYSSDDVMGLLADPPRPEIPAG